MRFSTNLCFQTSALKSGPISILKLVNSSANPGGDPKPPISILIADDDEVLAGMLGEYLETEGCNVTLSVNGADALEKIAGKNYDLLVLDVMMPVMNGIDALKELRASSSLPVIMLTARGDDLDRILGLELGADDYVSKPCNPRELFARIRAVLRRTQASSDQPITALEIDDIYANPATRGVSLNLESGSEKISLTQTEFDLLHLFLGSSNQIVSRSEMSMKILGKPLSQWDRSIDVHVSNLRKKLGLHASGQERIRTLRGSGYMYQTANSE